MLQNLTNKWIRIPTTPDFYDISVNDLLYVYIFLYSDYLKEKQTYAFSADEWESIKTLYSQKFDRSQTTTETDFQNLLDHNLIHQEKDLYVFPYIRSAAPVEGQLLAYLLQTKHPNIIKVYTILLSGQSYFVGVLHNESYSFSLASVRHRLGWDTSYNKRGDTQIRQALYLLASLGIMSCSRSRQKTEKGFSYPINILTSIVDESQNIVDSISSEAYKFLLGTDKPPQTLMYTLQL